MMTMSSRPHVRRRRCWRLLVVSGLLFYPQKLSSASPSFLSPGPIEDAHCNVEDLEEANDSQLYTILRDITKTNFFKTFHVDLNRKCPLASWNSNGAKGDPHEESTASSAEGEYSCSGDADELDVDAEPLCSVTPDNNNPLTSFESNALFSLSQTGYDSQQQKETFSWQKHSDAVVKTKPQRPHAVSLLTKRVQELSADDPADDTSCQGLPDDFWLDMCHPHDDDEPTNIDLTLNPERNTGYNGTHIWRAIYEENCIAMTESTKSDASTCVEQRVLYKLLSAMHSATTIAIAKHYYPPSKRKQRTDWEPNPEYFMRKFQDSPDYIRNLHFTYVVLLRALSKAAPYLRQQTDLIRTGNIVEDETATVLLHRLLDSAILESCGSVFTAFDEGIMFQDKNDAPELQRTFKGVFHNVSSILDCVQCQQCKLHGKLHMMGYGVALKLLFSKDIMTANGLSLAMGSQATEWLTRNEIVALINTIAKVSEAIRNVRTLTRLYVEKGHIDSSNERVMTPLQVPLNNRSSSDELGVSIDRLIGLAAELGNTGKLNLEQETTLVQKIFQRDADIIVLSKHYGHDTAKFLHMLSQTNILSSGIDCSNGTPDAVVVGSGLAGLVVALHVLDRGGRAVLIEKEHLLGGNSNKASSGINAFFSSYGDTVDAFRNDTLISAGSSADMELIEVLVNNSASAVTWLRERVGVDLSLVAQLGGHSFKRTHRPSNGMVGAEIIYAAQKAVKQYEKTGMVKIMLDTRVIGLVADDQGLVKGVKVTSTKFHKEVKEIYATNVVLATGGFAADRSHGSFLEKYRPEWLKMPTTAGNFSTGDGIVLATSLGAAVRDMDKIQIHPTGWVDPNDPNSTTKVLAAELMRGVGGILLNEQGFRFCNELGTRAYVTKKMLSHNTKFESSGSWDPEATVPTFFLVLSSGAVADGKKHIDLYSHKGLVARVEGIQGLAGYTGLPIPVLLETLTEYQADAHKGIDKFGKVSFQGLPMKDLDNEVFFVGRVTPVLHYCMGGIRIDKEGSVLTESGIAIPGLHAAGEVTGGVHGVNRLGGNSLLECTVFGSIVGKKLPVKACVGDLRSIPRLKQADSNDRKTMKAVSVSELATHNTPEDCWVAIYDVVYDLTAFAEEHPAGSQSIYQLAGRNGTEAFAAVHNKHILDDFADDRIGKLTL